MSDSVHQAVLLDEAVDALVGPSDGVYVDCTYGRGGHSARILDRLESAGRLIAFDRDGAAQAHAVGVEARDARFSFVRDNFSNLEAVLKGMGMSGQINGILMDLGVSSPQLDEAERGFSFRKSGPLDMRMDTSQSETAASWLAHASEETIADALYHYGEERRARQVARRICEVRKTESLDTTTQLAELVARVVGRGDGKKHPATRTFQAVRMVVNAELSSLEQALDGAESVLPEGGRLAVISFHSLEDRIVKRFFKPNRGASLPRGLPVESEPARWKVCGKPQRAGGTELQENARARSAVLRVAERCA